MFQISRISSRSSSSSIIRSSSSSRNSNCRLVSCLCPNRPSLLLYRNHLAIRFGRPVPPKCVTATVTKKSHFSSSTTTNTTNTSSSGKPSSSSSSSWLEGDIGALGTKVYHTLNLGLAVIVPIYFLTPERYTNGYISKTIGFGIATGISLHTYIGLNYVCRDYVPKISSKLLGPARIVTAGFSFILLVGMSKIALFSPNGIKGIITGLWTKPKKEE
jgi:hypothetical protein